MKNLKNMLLKLKWLGLELNLSWETPDQKQACRGGGGINKMRKKER